MPSVVDVAEHRQRNKDLLPKNRVWGFRAPARHRIRESVKQVAEPHQENGATGTTSVSGVVDWYINDHLGTPQRMIDGTGSVVWAADYAAFGKATVTTPTVENNLRFPGQYYDAETGLHYNWHRTYDPQLGRYLQSDPIGLWGGDLNLYAYVSNDPMNWIDPYGLAKGDWWDLRTWGGWIKTGAGYAWTYVTTAVGFVGGNAPSAAGKVAVGAAGSAVGSAAGAAASLLDPQAGPAAVAGGMNWVKSYQKDYDYWCKEEGMCGEDSPYYGKLGVTPWLPPCDDKHKTPPNEQKSLPKTNP